MKTVLITGVKGQAGSYLSELLLEKGYKVIGLARRSSNPNNDRIGHLLKNPNFSVVEGELSDPTSINKIVQEYQPDELYNTAAQSHVHSSFEQPQYTFTVNTIGTLNCLEAIRHYSKHTKFLQFSTSEMFGSNFNVDCSTGKKYQDENTPLNPRSPYAISKVAAHYLVNNYKEGYGLFASTIICFNYESPRRGENFVTRKITKWIADFYKNGLKEKLKLGNIEANRDWGHCKDYMRAAHMILQHDKPDNFVVSTGRSYKVKDFLALAFEEVDIINWKDYIEIDTKFFRPADVEFLLGDSSKIRRTLGWKNEIDFEDLVLEMVRSDINGLGI